LKCVHPQRPAEADERQNTWFFSPSIDLCKAKHLAFSPSIPICKAKHLDFPSTHTPKGYFIYPQQSFAVIFQFYNPF
jgi:hypothetical protein